MSAIVLPCMVDTISRIGGDIDLLHVDGTSGLTIDPKVSIIWMHVKAPGEKGEIVGQVISSAKTQDAYQMGFGFWKQLMEGTMSNNEYTNQPTGTFVHNIRRPSHLNVQATMTDKEQALIGALKESINPTHQILCRFHTLQALSNKVSY